MLTAIAKEKLNPVHAKLDWDLKRNERLFEEAVGKWFAFTVRQIQIDLRTKFQKDIASELTDWEYLQGQGEKILKPTTLSVMQSGGNNAYKLFQVRGAFDVLNPESVKAAEKFTADLVKEVNGQTKKGIRTYIKAGVQEGKSMDKVARELRPLVGLTDHQTQSIMNYRTLLGNKDKFPQLGASDIDRKVQRYSDKTHRGRARMIARTETARAQNIGYAEGMSSLGVEQLEFSTHPDERLCEICAGLEGKKFKTSEANEQIPVHPNCRCAMLPVVANTPVCRGAPGEVAKGVCIPPDSLAGEQIKDLLGKLEAADPVEGRKIRRALRTLGHKGGLGGKPDVITSPETKAPELVPKPKHKPKPTAIKEPTIEFDHIAFNEKSPNWRAEFKEAIESNKITSKWETPRFWSKEQKEFYLTTRDAYFDKLNAKIGKYKIQQNWERTLTRADSSALKFYQETFEGVDAIRHLQSGISPFRTLTPKHLKQAKNHLPKLDALLKRAPDYDGIMYRGMRLSSSDISKLKKGGRLTYNSTASSSGSKTQAEHFVKTFVRDEFNSGKSDIIFEIKAKKAVRLGKGTMTDPGLDEILIRKDTSYKIKSISKKTSKRLGKYTHIILEEI